MSQIYKSATGSTPSIPVQFTADSGSATPAANNLNLFTSDTSQDDDDGIRTIASGSTVTTQLTNRGTGQVTTVDATPTTIVSFTFGAVQAGATFEGVVTAIKNSNGQTASWRVFGSGKSNGTTATEVGSDVGTSFKDTDLLTSNVTFTAVGNAILISGVGVAATSINWDALITYRQVI